MSNGGMSKENVAFLYIAELQRRQEEKNQKVLAEFQRQQQLKARMNKN